MGRIPQSELARYEEHELSTIERMGSKAIKRGYVASASDLYPDVVLPDGVGWAGGAVGLATLALLYERVAIYVPPMGLTTLEQKWGLPMSSMVEFVESGLIQPVIGHPTDYSAPHFERLLDSHPPSVWARGVSLLRLVGQGDIIDEGRCPLPIDKMARLPGLASRFTRHFPAADVDELQARVRLELLTNYADLVLFGEQELADSLAGIGEPGDIARALLLCSELRTYPTLFGLGGTPNHNIRELQEAGAAVEGLDQWITRSRDPVVIPNLDVLATGLGVDLAHLSPNEIVDFHASGAGRALRRALRELEADAHRFVAPDGGRDLSALLDTALRMQQQLDHSARELLTPSHRRLISRQRSLAGWSFWFGATVLGTTLGTALGGAVAALVGGIVPTLATAPESVRASVGNAWLRLRLGSIRANLWQVRERAARR